MIKKKISLILVLGLCVSGGLGWLAGSGASEETLTAHNNWPYEFALNKQTDAAAFEKVLSRRAEALNKGFLFPQNPQSESNKKQISSQIERSETGREVPEEPIIIGAAIKNGKFLVYVSEEDEIVGYGIKDELTSGWVIENADLSVVDLMFDNIRLTVDILSAQNE